MKTQLLVPLLIFLLAYGCRSEKDATQLLTKPTAVATTPSPREEGVPDTLPKRRLFSLLPPAQPKPAVVVQAGTPLNVGKKSTVIVQSGSGNTAAVVGKKSGPVAQADSGATIQQAQTKKGPAAAAGRDLTQTVAPPASDWWKWLVVGTVLGFCIRQFGPKLVRVVVPVACLLLVTSCAVQHLPGPRELQTAHSPHPAERHALSGPAKRALRGL